MSTILKALKQSESRRPREASLPGSLPRAAPAGPAGMRWWLPAGLAVVIAAGAGWWLLAWQHGGEAGSDTPPRGVAEVSMPARPSPAPEETSESPGTADPADPAARAAPPEKNAGQSGSPANGAPETAAADSEPEQAVTKAESPEASGPAIPEIDPPKESGTERPGQPPEPATLDEYALLPRLAHLAPARRKALPALTLNAHVYAPDPAESFVLINLSRYGEGDRVSNGVRVAKIFPGGVVIEDGEGRFVLPRP